MDPFLEHPSVFPGLHDRLIAYLSESLQSRLPEPYFSEIGERLWVETSDRSIGLDVYVLEGEERDRDESDSGRVGLATVVRSQPIVVTVPQDEFREPYEEDRCYDAGPYRRRIRYRQTEPVPPLDAERQAWVARLLEYDAQKANEETRGT